MGVGIAEAASAGLALERFGAGGVTLLSLSLLSASGLSPDLLCSARLVDAVCPAPVRRLASGS